MTSAEALAAPTANPSAASILIMRIIFTVAISLRMQGTVIIQQRAFQGSQLTD
jgi:hypothetical protein